MRLLPFFIFIGAIAVFGGTAAAAEPSARQLVHDKIQGSRIYASECVECHGKTGRGVPGAAPSVPDFSTPQAVVRYDLERMIDGTRRKHPDHWPTWEESGVADDVPKIIAYMREAFMLPAPTEDASAGRTIYARTCSVCHGDRGNGASWAQNSLNPAPADFTSEKVKELSRRHMLNTVTYGSKDTAMQGFSSQLSRDEIAAVVDYIRSTFMFPDGTPEPETTDKPVLDFGKISAAIQRGKQKPTTQAAELHAAASDSVSDQEEAASPTRRLPTVPAVIGAPDMAAPMPAGLVGDPASGKEFFQNNCYVCHGREGGGDGPRAYFIRPKPADLTSKDARESLNRPELFKTIAKGVRGSEMPAWSKIVSDQKIADIAEYVFTTFIRPTAADTADAVKKKF